VEKTQPVVFRTHAHAEWISLVKHGANRTPFYLIKSDGGSKLQVIQSILVPKGITLAQLASRENLTFLVDAKDQKISHDDFDEYLQIPADQFEPGTLMLDKLADDTQVRVGTLKSDRPDALVWKQGDVGVLHQEMPQPDTVADVLYRDWQALQSSVFGALGSSGLDDKKRKQMVFAAIDGFKTAMSMLMDQVSGGVIKVEKSEDKPVEWFKDKEEFEQFVATVATAAAEQVFAKAKESEAAEKAEAERVAAEKAEAEKVEAERLAKAEEEAKAEADAKAGEAAEAIEKLKAELEARNAELEAKVAELTEKAEKFGEVIEADPASEGGDDKVTKKDAEAKFDPKDWGGPLAGAMLAQG
jgi:hypothetical protein